MTFRKITPDQRAEIIAWARNRAELGTPKQIANRYGVTVEYLYRLLGEDRERRTGAM